MAGKPVVGQIMTHDPSTVTPNDTIRTAIERMKDRGCRRLPVIEDGRLVGIVSNIDLRRATNSPLVLRERWYDEFVLDHIPIRGCMTPNPITVQPDTPVVECAKLMRDRKIGGLPVTEEGKLIGMVTETDLLNHLITILDEQSSAN